MALATSLPLIFSGVVSIDGSVHGDTADQRGAVTRKLECDDKRRLPA